MRIIILLLLILSLNSVQGQSEPLFIIYQDNKVGYMNEKGSVIIKPVYLNGNDFSEGLASVRLNGLYGFIDKTGKFIIQPEFDYANNFYNGLAVVYKDGKPSMINKKGEIAFPAVYKSIGLIDDRKGIITTQTGKQGIIDIHSKNLIVDTIFGSISQFKYGVSIVSSYVESNLKRKEIKAALIDINGNFVVPYGIYQTIQPFSEGYAVVKINNPENEDESAEGVIDSKGRLLFKRPYEFSSSIEGEFINGLARLNLYKSWVHTSDKYYKGFINLQGEVFLNDSFYTDVKDFSYGRTFAKPIKEDYILMDRNFKRVGSKTFESIVNEKFQNGYAIVESDYSYGIIDTMGNFVAEPEFDEIHRVGIIDGYFFFGTEKNDKMHYGISDLKGNIISEAVMREFDKNGFVNGLLKAIINGKFSYVNKMGKIVWQEQEQNSNTLKQLNIDFMNRGYLYAYSTPSNTDKDASGGWATSSNHPKIISQHQFPSNTLAVTIDTTITVTFANNYSGYKLFISNNSCDTIEFNAQDSRLYIKLQAQNKDGNWKDIEYMPNSWCGNSYHQIKLEPNAFWDFVIPNYQGEFSTKIRAELKYVDKADPKKEKIVYSNIINGSINPGQFWNKRTYYPLGLMDPYID